MPKLPIDPRDLLPSRADPEHRSRRKELEKQHGYGYTEPLILAAIGIGLVWNIDNQVRKHEERKDEAEKAAEERRERKRQRELDQYGLGRGGNGGGTRSGSRYDDSPPRQRNRSRDRRRGGGGGGGGGDWDDRRRGRDGGSDSRSRPRPRDSSRYAGGRPDDVRDDPRALDYRYEEYRGFRDDYKDFRNDYRYEDRRAGSARRSSRRDSF